MKKRVREGFFITGGKGFHITFSNDWTISVQFGPGNYCEHYNRQIGDDVDCGKEGSLTAEVAVINPAGNLVDLDGDSVLAHQSPDEVLLLMNAVAEGDLKPWKVLQQLL